MPRRRTKKEQEYTPVVATIDGYDINTRASINSYMDPAFRDLADDEEPVFTFETELTIHATCTQPAARKAHTIELALLSPHLSRRLRYQIERFQKRDDKGAPVYKKYRDGEFPVYQEPSGIARVACCELVEAGVSVCAPIHDAVLIEAPLAMLSDAVRQTQHIMSDASAVVLDGFRLRSDVEIVRYPARYMDERCRRMWDTVIQLLDEAA